VNLVLPLVIGALGVGYPALFAAMTLSRAPRWRAKSRVDVLVEGLTAALMLVLVHEFFAWWVVPAALWLVPVAIFAAGVVGAVIRWPSLPWMREGRTLRRAVLGASVSVVVVAVILWVVLG